MPSGRISKALFCSDAVIGDLGASGDAARPRSPVVFSTQNARFAQLMHLARIGIVPSA